MTTGEITSSRYVQFSHTGDATVLTVERHEVRAPEAGEVRIRTHAIGLNRAEIMFRNGRYIYAPQLPAGLGYEAAGEVEAIGPDVTGLELGQRVSVVPSFSMNDYPMYGEVVLAPAYAVVPVPENVSWEGAAAAWMQNMTAYGALIQYGGLSAGDTALITAASSSVGLAAIQIANLIGARPIALTRTSAKRDRLLELGANAVIATQEDDVLAEARRLTGEAGAQVIMDPVGGPLFETLTAVAADHGWLVLYGGLSSEPTPLSGIHVVGKQLTIHGLQIFSITSNPQRREAAIKFISDGLASGALNPVIDRTFSLDEIADAHRYLDAGNQIGKVVITV